ncbi:MAG: sugar phosphate isomerase/epimerase [Clostridiales bacterium]|nr:sugar phosphate isomerase/epimerase [Clostridiales bacterium]
MASVLWEFWDWRIRDLEETRTAAQDAGIIISGFNGDADYSLVDHSQKEAYLDDLKRSLDAALKVGSKSVTIHSNALGDGG